MRKLLPAVLGAALQRGAVGFTRALDSDYDSARRIEQYVKADIKL